NAATRGHPPLMDEPLDFEDERADDDAGEKASPRLVIPQDAPAAQGPAAVDRRCQGVEPARHQRRAHVAQVGRREEVEDLDDPVHAVRWSASAEASPRWRGSRAAGPPDTRAPGYRVPT